MPLFVDHIHVHYISVFRIISFLGVVLSILLSLFLPSYWRVSIYIELENSKEMKNRKILITYRIYVQSSQENYWMIILHQFPLNVIFCGWCRFLDYESLAEKYPANLIPHCFMYHQLPACMKSCWCSYQSLVFGCYCHRSSLSFLILYFLCR